jgi:hypothetical protein
MGRSVFSTHPSMGLPPTWKVSDLTPSYSTPAVIQAATAVNIISASFNPQANSVEIYPQFSDGKTSCDISILNDDGTGTFHVVATFTGITLFKASGLSVGEYPTGISLGGRAIQVQVANIAGGGTVAVLVQRLN